MSARGGQSRTAGGHRWLRWLGRFVLVLFLIGCGWGLYVVAGPGPLDFAGGHLASLGTQGITDPSGVPAALKEASSIEKGAYLARAADCVVCHTAPDGVAYAGGLALTTPLGTIYSTNITPDPETGIGQYSDQQFLDAVRRGIRRDGAYLYPAMPYPSYSYMSDGDALAIKAYLSSLKPVRSTPQPNALAFPFNHRRLVAFWNAFFSSNKRYEVNTDRDAQWNRGAYLAEALAHCGDCHTPRTAFYSLNNRKKFSGETLSGWRAYNASQDQDSGIGSWSPDDLRNYLSTGHANGRGTASGPMGDVVDESLSYLVPEDIAALTAYLKTIPAAKSGDAPIQTTIASTSAPHDESARSGGALIFAGSCAGCHGWNGQNPALPMADLIGSRAVNDSSGINVVNIIVHGGQHHPRESTSTMPAFVETYTNSEIADVANFVTARYGRAGSHVTAAGVEQLRRFQ